MFIKDAVDEKQQLREDIKGVLKPTKPPKRNIKKEERSARRDLHVCKDKSMLSLPADMGRTTVDLDKEDYEMNVSDLWADERIYEQMSKDATQE